MPKKILFLLTLVSILLYPAEAVNMDLKWQYEVGTKEKNVYVNDLDHDRVKEVIITTNDNIYVLGSDGALRWERPVSNLVSIHISDLEWDEKREVVASSGTTMGNIARGNVWIFEGDGALRWIFPSGRVKSNKILRGIKAIDMDGNGYKEIVGGTGYGVTTLADSYNEFLWHSSLNKSITEVSTEFKGWVLANSHSDLFLIDFSGSVKWNYSIRGGINRVYFADFYPRSGEEIFVVSFRDSIHVLNRDGGLEVEVNVTQGKVNAIPLNLDDDDYDEILLVSDRVVYALDVNKDVIWDYNISEEILDITVRDIDHDGNDGILLFTERRIYEINMEGNFEHMYDPGLAHNIDSITIDDFEDDDEDEFIINSVGEVYVFNINWDQVDREMGERYYREAHNYFTLGVYENASRHVEKARGMYLKLGDNENLVRCVVLAAKITAGIREKKKALAGDYYQKAEYYYNKSVYENASLYLSNASILYMEARDSEGIIKCRLFSRIIRDAIKGIETSTILSAVSTSTPLTTSIPVTSVPLETTSTVSAVPSDNQVADSLMSRIPALLAVLIIVLVIIFIRKKGGKK